jgi:3-hydroxyisobutyrate dehydrogenase-like beta-hydroxyacid dehydrogenase
MPQKIGVVGIGIMGQRMCRNLVKAGFPVVAHDLSPTAAQLADALGAGFAADLPSLARQVDVVLLSLPGPPQVLAVTEGPQGLLAHLRPGAHLCDASTVDPGTSRRVYDAARAKGIHALAPPAPRPER